MENYFDHRVLVLLQMFFIMQIAKNSNADQTAPFGALRAGSVRTAYDCTMLYWAINLNGRPDRKRWKPGTFRFRSAQFAMIRSGVRFDM